MREWVARSLARIESGRVLHLKPAQFQIEKPSVTVDYAGWSVIPSDDFVRQFATIRVQNSDVELPPAAVGDAADECRMSTPKVYYVLVPDIAKPDILDLGVADFPAISPNHLKPLFPDGVRGKNYRDKPADVQQKSLFPSDEQPHAGELRKAYKESSDSGRTVRQMLDIWDLLFPLLKPPLELDVATNLDLPGELRPYQIEGVQRLIRSPAFLLADEMGTGKTVMTSVALRILFHEGLVQRAVVVCPKSILGVWDRHLRDWASTLAVTVVRGSKDVRSVDWRCPAHVYVVTYDTLRNDVEPASGAPLAESSGGSLAFDAVIVDEAHAIKNPNSGRAKAVRTVSTGAKFRWALTGTPIQNKVEDLCAIFEFLDPSVFGEETQPTPQSARSKIEPYFLRRRKKDVLPELPQKIRSDEWLELDEDQRIEYEHVISMGREFLRAGNFKVTKFHVFRLLKKLQKLCNFATGSTKSPKTVALLEQIEEIVASESKVLVFTQFKEDYGVARLAALLQRFGVVCMTGDTSHHERERVVHRFQNDPSARVFLATVKTAGEGISLTAASYVIHFDHWWNPATAWQAEDRAHRRGQSETVNVYRYWMRGTVEERIYEILKRKGVLHSEVIDSLAKDDFDDALSINDLLGALELTRDDVRIAEDEPVSPARRFPEVHALLGTVDPFEFEHIVTEVFRRVLGFPNARTTKRSADGGIDMEATKTVQGRVHRVVAQCKRRSVVGPDVARELLGVLALNPDLTTGYLVTSGKISRACRELCESSPKLKSIEGVELAKLICDHGISIAQRSEGA